jgi:hypothetical protein
MPINFPNPFAPTDEDPDRLLRALAGAGIGLFSGSLFVLVAGTIDHFAFPMFHMRIDWAHMAGLWLLTGLLLSALCGLAALTMEVWPGVPLSAAAMAVAILITNIAQGKGEGFTNFLLLIILIIPLTGLMVPVAWVFRWLAGKFVQGVRSRGAARFGDFTLVLLIAILLGLTPGVLSRMNRRVQSAVLQVNTLLEQGAQTPAGGSYPGPLENMPGYAAHAAQGYTLNYKPSAYSTEGFDVTARFADGYSIKCIVVVYPGQAPYLLSCRESPE